MLRNLIVCNLIVVCESNGCFLLKGGKCSQQTEGGHGSWKQEVCQEVADRSHADLLWPTKNGLHRLPHLLTFTHTNTNKNAHTLTVQEASVIQTSCRHWLSPLEREAVKKLARDRLYALKKWPKIYFLKLFLMCVFTLKRVLNVVMILLLRGYFKIIIVFSWKVTVHLQCLKNYV